MNTQIDVPLLRRLHRILRQQADLNGRIRRAPGKVNVAKQAMEAFQTNVEESGTLLKQTRMNADRKQLQLQEREARIDDLKAKRNGCESNREYQLLNDQVAADEKANSVQSDEILELLERIDEIQEAHLQAESNLEKGKAEAQRIQGNVDRELEALNRDLDEVIAELNAAESRLPVDIKNEYRRLVSALGEEALASVSDDSCGHCYTNQTTQVISELMMKRAVFCTNCGSLLYLPDNAAV